MQCRSILSWLPFFDRRRGRLVRHYFLVFMVLIGGGMIASGFLEIYFRYYETRKLIGDMRPKSPMRRWSGVADYFLQIEQQLKTALTTREIADKGLSQGSRSRIDEASIARPSDIRGDCD